MSLKYKLQQYLRYKLHAKNEFSLHSPFMFDLYNEVFKKSKKADPDFDKIETRRRLMLRNENEITFIDHGAGSSKAKSPIRKISTIAKSTSKSAKYARFITNLAAYLKSDSILELGTSLGVSTMYLAEKNKESHITTIEGSNVILKIAEKNFKDLGYRNISSLDGDFDDILPSLILKNKYNFVFIDGNHTYKATTKYFELLKNYSLNDAVIVFDDIYWNEDMTKAWKEIIAHEAVTASIDMFEFGIVFFRKELSKQDFILRF